MNLAVSNIAWPAEDEGEAARTLRDLHVAAIEIAPTKVFADTQHVPDAEIVAYQRFWESYGIKIVAFQSMLFGRPDLTIFEDPRTRSATGAYLAESIRLASRMGVQVLVFGSPRNRRVPDQMSAAHAMDIATAFFGDLGLLAAEVGTTLCIEPNPRAYDCNFVFNARQGAELVARVDSPGFGLHLDAAGMTLAGDSVYESITQSPAVRHFHISAPQLAELEESVVDHDAAARALREIGYARYVSIEMRPGSGGDTAGRVRRAVALARRHYGDLT